MPIPILTSSSSTGPLLEARQLHLWRGERHILRGLSFSLQAGQALQVSWVNGAGKTSLIRALAGLLLLESGTILWQGRDTSSDLRGFRGQIAYFGHELGLKGDLTAGENLRFLAGLRVPSTAHGRKTALDGVGLRRLVDEPVRRLSAGQQRRVALASLGLQDAALWLLDEPAAHLDSQGQQMVTELVDSHLKSGGAAIIATHQPLPLAADCSSMLPPELPC